MAISASNLQASTIEKVIFGGTFDPVHNGHLISAQELASTMGYRVITLMPCGQAYHKEGVSHAQHRLNMLNIAAEKIVTLDVDDQEVLREGATYTVDTLQAMRNQLGSQAHLVWVMGTDSAKSLKNWHQWQSIFNLANVIVISRAGEPKLDLLSWPAIEASDINTFKQQACGYFYQLALTPVALSSTEIRTTIENHQPVDNHVPQAVIEYIEQHGLYRGIN